MQPTPHTEAPQDPYDGVPLGVEALVPFLRVVDGAGSDAFADASIFFEGTAS